MTVHVTTENKGVVELSQGEAYINFGTAAMSTFNLLNCISFGGKFDNGLFLTHELPEDVDILKRKLLEISSLLDDHVLTNTVLFRIEPSQAIGDIEPYIEDIIRFSYHLFGVYPEIHEYSCNRTLMKCGEAIITPNEIKISTHSIRPDTASFLPVYCSNNGKDILIRCPECGTVSTKFLKTFSHHRGACDNNGKKPDLRFKPESAEELQGCTRGGTRRRQRRR